MKWVRTALVALGVFALSLGIMACQVETPWSSEVTALHNQIDSLQSEVKTLQDQIVRLEASRYVALGKIGSLKVDLDRQANRQNDALNETPRQIGKTSILRIFGVT